MIWIGTSGWVYPHWVGRFYPPGLRPAEYLAFYAQRFPTVEINRSFYRLPTRANFVSWAAEVTKYEHFCFAVKASRYLTHLKKLKDAADGVQRLTSAISGLGPRLGPVLYQLPPHWRVDVERLETFLRLLPLSQRAAFEFRDPTWHCPEVVRLLERGGCALVVGVFGDSPTPDAALTAGPFRYVRFHHGAHGTGLTDGELDAWAERLRAEEHGGRDVFVYFNNDPDGHAIVDADRLRQRLADLCVAPT